MKKRLTHIITSFVIFHLIIINSFGMAVCGAEAKSASSASSHAGGAPVSGTLYVVGHGIGGNSYGLPPIPARLTAIDLASQREKFSFDRLYEARLSPNGEILYLADHDELLAVDSNTGSKLWQVTKQGNSALFWPSPDSSYLYFYYDFMSLNMPRAALLQIYDLREQKMAPKPVGLPVEYAEELLAPTAGDFVYIPVGQSILALNIHSQRVERNEPIGLIDKTEVVRDADISHDGRSIFLVTNRGRLIVYDTKRRVFSQPAPLIPPKSGMYLWGTMVALSGNGRRLVVAQNVETAPGIHVASTFRILDTRNWRTIAEFTIPHPIASLTVDGRGKTVYSVVDKLVHTREHLPNDTFIEVDADKGKVRARHLRRNEHLRYILIRR